MIKTENVSKLFRTTDVVTRALNQVSFEIKKGEFIAIMGPSGCGKSTLLNILGLLDSPSSGEYFFLAENVTRMSEWRRAKIRKQNIGFVFQNFNLIDELTVFENVELPLRYTGIPGKERKDRVEQILDQAELSKRKNHYPGQLSGGQQQRVAFARAMIAEPSLILADEPTGNLDSAHGEEIMNLLAKMNEKGATIVMVTHSQRDAKYSHRILNLFDGQIISENE
ncbi:MAG: ABC transporter ATP-binding protein [Bacteroidales bacterium]|jgi:putative ABC transport system ATP-binding protein|nr:ABC transporter ATP-binding protein [Bacteroidales bacterium]